LKFIYNLNLRALPMHLAEIKCPPNWHKIQVCKFNLGRVI
jgi:hypothetical protein